MSLPTTFFVGRGGGSSGPTTFEEMSVLATFNNTSTGRSGSLQTYTIPSDGFYCFVVRGAKGADNTAGGQSGGAGRSITSFAQVFSAGTHLKILVGQAGLYSPGGAQNNSGGGGGSFIWNNSNNTLYVAAGGGGGAASVDYSYKNAPDSINGNDGFRHLTAYPTSQGGSNGQGGHHGDGDNRGGGGAGWLSDGKGNQSNTPDFERTAYRPLSVNFPGRGGAGGRNGDYTNGAEGGFGGGGGGGYHGTAAYGGGGGGYSGGGGGSWNSSSSGPGGGGGSYALAGTHTSVLHYSVHGQVEVYG